MLSKFVCGGEQIRDIRWSSGLLISQHNKSLLETLGVSRSLAFIHTNNNLSWLSYLEFGLRFSTARCVPLEALLDHLLLRTSSYEALQTMQPEMTAKSTPIHKVLLSTINSSVTKSERKSNLLQLSCTLLYKFESFQSNTLHSTAFHDTKLSPLK